MPQKPSRKTFARRFARDEQGGVLIIFGLCVVFLTAIGGAAVDLGMQQLMRLKLQNSVDAAVTSAGSLTSCKVLITPQIRTQAAQRYFALNYPERFADNTTRPPLNVTRSDDDVISAEANDDLVTHFVSNFAVRTLAAEGRSGASVKDINQDTNFDAVIVVDESGSMANTPEYFVPDRSGATIHPLPSDFSQTRAQAARNAFTTFVTNVFPDCVIRNPNVRMGMIGFTGFVSNCSGKCLPGFAQGVGRIYCFSECGRKCNRWFIGW